MKSSEAKPLTAEELQTLKGLLQRWVLVSYPYFDWKPEYPEDPDASAYRTYDNVFEDAKRGHQRDDPERVELGGGSQLN